MAGLESYCRICGQIYGPMSVRPCPRPDWPEYDRRGVCFYHCKKCEYRINVPFTSGVICGYSENAGGNREAEKD